MGRKLDVKAFSKVLELKKYIDSDEMSIYSVAKIVGCSTGTIYNYIDRINQDY